MQSFLTGMDIAHVRRLASEMEAEAQTVRGDIAKMSALINAAPWRGNDRNRFVDEWRERHAAALQRVVDGLETAARQAREHARLQEITSKA